MAKQKSLSPDQIISSLSSLSENELMSIAKAVSQEAQKRDEALEQEIKEKEEKRAIIKSGGK